MYDIRVITELGEMSLDYNGTSFPYTFESSSVAELQDQSASWSYSIEIPRTANNEAVMGSAGVPYVRAYTPYMKRLVNVYADGVLIIKRGVMFIDSTTKSAYQVQIISGNADVFERMQDVSFENWGAETKVTLPFRTYPTDAELADKPYDYLRNVHISREQYYPDIQLLPTTDDGGVYRYARPYALVGGKNNARGLLKRVLDYYGLTLQTNTLDSELDSMWLSVADDKYISIGSEIWSDEATPYEVTTQGTTQHEGELCYPKINDQLVTDVHIEWQPETLFNRTISNSQHLAAYINTQGLFMDVYDEKGVRLAHKFYNRAQWESEGSPSVLTADLTFDATYKSLKIQVEVNGNWEYRQGTQVSRSITWNSGSPTETTGLFRASAKTRLRDENDIYNGDGATINLEASLGIDTPLDFFKLLAQVFGWVVNIKDDTIRAYTFGYIKSRKAFALDWSDKLLTDNEQTAYAFGEYGRINRISFGENSEIPYTDADQFEIPDQKLEPEKDVIETGATSHLGNVVELWKRTSEDGAEVTEYDWAGGGGGTHLIMVDSNTGEAEPYSTQYVMANYQPLIDTLQMAQVKNVKMLLSALDVQTFDPYYPIFLRPYGAYFYVNKISEWENGKPCDVELLKL